ncbi:MAG: TPM domain-containing protein [Thermoanaerobaculia bacterium]
MKQKDFLATLDQQKIVEAIADAERRCSGEVRVHVQPRVLGGDIRTVAERTFERLGMTKTAARNGVLLFIASEQQKFVILGDRGIHDKVGDGYWDGIAAALTERFKSGEFTAGIVEAIEAIGTQLCTYFPWVKGDVNELPNEISVEDERDD